MRLILSKGNNSLDEPGSTSWKALHQGQSTERERETERKRGGGRWGGGEAGRGGGKILFMCCFFFLSLFYDLYPFSPKLSISPRFLKFYNVSRMHLCLALFPYFFLVLSDFSEISLAQKVFLFLLHLWWLLLINLIKIALSAANLSG